MQPVQVWYWVGCMSFHSRILAPGIQGKHVIAAESKDRGSSEEDCNSFPKQSAVTWVKCNRTSPCPVIRQGSYVTLIKLMHGMKLLNHIRGNETYSPKRPFRIKCDHFTLFDYREGALRWVQNSNRHHVEPNGSVTITTSAVYGLYNRFTMAGIYHDDDNKAEILHQVYLETSAGNRSKILFERNIALFAQSRSFDTSAYFDFVYLREGDRVYPTISNITYLYGMPKANTWGVFQLS
ncbi:uncharacterized protein LOC117341709 isoform X1 [Pecten maximus]|uniref:uncharacterized protein LOC117341709 isoform X1 n=1 Tax=Pecten maximus TaxID=6579 RepID=UPI001458DB6C|nr:uncharacterized protein LOC117341709 isoform X1 [Pecten maximus]